MAFHEMEIEAFEATARRLVDENLDAQFYVETYAANPDHAGSQLNDLLNNLPVAPESKSRDKVNAFIGLRILQRTHEQISLILGDDMYMQQQLDEHHQSDVDISGSLPSDSPTTKQQDRDIRKSARGEPGASDVDRDIRRESGMADDIVHESFQQALHGGDDQDEGVSRSAYRFDFSGLSPAVTFRSATRQMVEQIMHTALSKRRLKPLFDNDYTTEDDVDALCDSLRHMVSRLRFDDGGGHEDEDDEDVGEDWKH